MKMLCKLLIAIAIVLITVFASDVIAHCIELSFEAVYCHVASFVIGVLAANFASRLINKKQISMSRFKVGDSMNWKAIIAKLRATIFHKEAKEDYNARLIFDSSYAIALERCRKLINGEAEVLIFHIKSDLSRATLADVLTEAKSIGHGKAVVSRLYQVDIKDFVVNSESWHTDDYVGIGLLQEECGQMVFMPKCNLFSFHTRELNIYPRQIPESNNLAMFMVIPIKELNETKQG